MCSGCETVEDRPGECYLYLCRKLVSESWVKEQKERKEKKEGREKGKKKKVVISTPVQETVTSVTFTLEFYLPLFLQKIFI